MKLLPLTKQTFAQVDDEDFERLSKFHWYDNSSICRHESRKIKAGDFVLTKRIAIPLANEVMKIEGIIFDHKDTNKYNNQKNNLRECDYSSNNFNRKKQKNCSSEYKGVYKVKNGWRACIMLNNKTIHLGFFIDEIEAAKMYDKKAVELFNEFACLNFK